MTTTSPPSKRVRLDLSPSPSPNDENVKEGDDLEQEHCTICLQPFLDRTIVPVCAHEFCFECILLWSEQSRKCPLCARSFDDSHLIHHIRSQYDYQKHYLLPLRSSPPPSLVDASRANVLRRTRRERQWGRIQRQQREEADQLERAIARRRWIYQHHLYAKHVASNPHTRYRPFPTPAQFAASPDLISRMTTFLRRELHVWPNLDVEFLTTYTISLMKSIDIRSESAVKLLSEFLDIDVPYAAGERHANAEHFAHEIYSYLRSPYRDLNTYDQTAQYDTPPEIPPPQEIERGRRWSAEPSPSRRSGTRSQSRHRSPAPRREDSAIHSPPARHGRDSSAEAHRDDRQSGGHDRDRSPRSIPPGEADNDSRNHLFGTGHSPLDGVRDVLRNDYSRPREMLYPEGSTFMALAAHQDLLRQSRFPGDEKGIGRAMQELDHAAHTTKMRTPQDNDSAAAAAVGEADMTRLIGGLVVGTGDDYVANVRNGSSANAGPSRKRSAGLGVHDVHPRNRTLSESVQAYLSRPTALQRSTRKPSVSGDQRADTGATGESRPDVQPSLLLRLTDGATGSDMGKLPPPRKTPVGKTGTPNDLASEQLHPGDGRRSQSCAFSSNLSPSTGGGGTEHTIVGRGTSLRRLGSHTEDESCEPCTRTSGDANPERLELFPPVIIRTAQDVTLSRAMAVEDLVVEGLQTGQRGGLVGQGYDRGAPVAVGTTGGGGRGDPVRHGGDALDFRVGASGGGLLMGGTVAPAPTPLDDHSHEDDHRHDTKEVGGDGAVDMGTGQESAGFTRADASAASLPNGAVPEPVCGVGGGAPREGSGAATTSTPASKTAFAPIEVDASALEARLRARARVRVRLAAVKATGGPATPLSGSSTGTDSV